MHASRIGETSAVEVLGKVSDVELDLVNTLGQSAHALAYKNGHQDAMALLVGLGAKPCSQPVAPAVGGLAGLHEAAACGDAELVRGILSRNEASVDAPFKGETALLRAASAGHTLVVEALLGAKADPDRGDDFHGETPLWRAVLNHKIEVVWLLLNAGVNASQPFEGRTPIELAESWNFWDMADLISIKTGGRPLANGRSIHDKCHWGGPVPQINNRPPPSEESAALMEPLRMSDNLGPGMKDKPKIQVVESIADVEDRCSSNGAPQADLSSTESHDLNVTRADPDSNTVASMAGEFSSLD
jgi:ankyrin repeat protein